MRREGWWRGVLFSLVAAGVLVAAGCSPAEKPQDKGDKAAQAAGKPRDDHSGWWCPEHGVPEEVCGQCNARYAAECRRKGDWCKEHERPDSECFICHPERKEKFAKLYRSKYGTEPPPIEEEMDTKEGNR
jgi:hypothetical protein